MPAVDATGVRKEAAAGLAAKLVRAEEQRDSLAEVLLELLGSDPAKDRWGYGAAGKAMDDAWRARARAALERAKGGQ